MVGLSGGASEAISASADGSVIVGQSIKTTQAVVWDESHGMRSIQQVLTDDGLNLTSWNLEEATEVSANGNTIVGFGTDPSGLSEGWIATIPEPGTGLLVMGGVLDLAVARRRRA